MQTLANSFKDIEVYSYFKVSRHSVNRTMTSDVNSGHETYHAATRPA